MKKRMWLWCLIAAFGMSIVACGDDEKETEPIVPPTDGQQTPVVPPTDGQQTPVVPPTDGQQTPPPSQSVIVVDTMEVIANVEEVPCTGGTIQFVTKTNVVYSVDTDQEWIKITSDGRALTAEYTVTATVDANEGEAREGVITVTFEDEATTVKTVTVKQAAKPAEDPEPTPETGVVADMTVEFEYEAGAASGKLDGAEITAAAKTALGLDDLASAQIMGFLADGTMAELQTTVAVEGGFACDGWMTAEGIMTSWGTEHAVCIKPWSTPESMDVFLASTEVGTTAVGYFAYVNGDAKYVVKVNVTVVEPEPVEPGTEFETPEADFIAVAELVNKSGETGSWALTAEDEMAILATLGLDGDYNWEGALATAVEEGAVTINGYNADGTYHPDYTANGGYWCAADGTVTSWGTNHAIYTEAFSNYGYLGGSVGQNYGQWENGATATIPLAYVAGDKAVVIVVEINFVEPDPEPEFTVEETYEFTLDVVYAAEYADAGNGFNISATMADIADIIGGTPDTFQMGLADGTFQNWNITDGWFGIDGAQYWGNSAVFCMKPQADGTFGSNCCMPDVSAGQTGYCVFRYGNSATMKAVDVKITVNVAAE